MKSPTAWESSWRASSVLRTVRRAKKRNKSLDGSHGARPFWTTLRMDRIQHASLGAKNGIVHVAGWNRDTASALLLHVRFLPGLAAGNTYDKQYKRLPRKLLLARPRCGIHGCILLGATRLFPVAVRDIVGGFPSVPGQIRAADYLSLIHI